MAGKQKLKIGINNIVSWGATVVIIGLLFKIQHWPYSSFFISLGLLTEAGLFFILGFQNEPVEVDWTRVYPELAEDAQPVIAAPKATGAAPASLDKMMADAKIGPELIGSLGEGLRTFSEKVATISKVADAGTATQEFTSKLKAASASYDNLNAAFTKASSGLADFASSSADTKTYHDQVSNLAKNLSALNAVYELELQDSSAHLKSMNKFYQNLSATMQGFTESVDDSKKFKDEVGRLAKNIASLNAVYGNMLSAMSAPKA
ncbi:gliding motility protein GldL [Mucilaginibacter sp. PPCGB 2223]|uniref:type IX secretion system motor protein PorL/GldL n=1 Tax=Mucilaginibacter sp. PPCGB 2223 TaxID=1886027 RepID=UPI0008265DEB|nr:gliding motility protein GldL [Mucilaginibacter sp. PPCGB 2223]OCX51022.1 gliding motility protein GldL [Mucilaginibacter sp. PPCGB 2223]